MVIDLKAIQTVFDGYRFRSRLEARWAVFFKTLGIPYEYEKEGFDLGDGIFYLPDFWLPDQRCWIEIKGQRPTKREEDMLNLLAQKTGCDAYCFWGPIPMPRDYWGNGSCVGDSAYKYFSDEGWDNYHQWCICVHCGKLGIEFDGRSERLNCDCPKGHKDFTAGHPTLVAAYTAARSARFEHGEQG